MEPGKPFTVSTFLETVGLTRHHYCTILFASWIFVFAGWAGTAPVYIMDAAAQINSDWTHITSAQDRLTVEDRSWILLVGSILAAFGNALIGYWSDIFGRILVMECCIANGLIAAIGFVVARSKVQLLLCLIINPFIKDGAAGIAQVLLAEWAPVQWRGILIIALHATWNVGRLAMTFLWVVLPPGEHWHAFVVASGMPILLLSAYTRFRAWQYESPRWLAVSGYTKQCIETLQLAADGVELPEGWDHPDLLKVEDHAGGLTQAEKKSSFEKLADLNTPDIRRSLATMSASFFAINWASGAFFYWSIEYFEVAGLREAVQPAMVAAPVAKVLCVVGMIVGGPGRCIIDTWPRVFLVQLGFAGFGVCLLVMCSLTSTVPIVASVFLLNAFEELVWTAGSVYCIEIFPTSVRNTAGSVVWTCGNLGGIIGNSLSGELMKIWPCLPFLVASAWMILGTMVCFFSQEDRGKKTLSDVGQSYGATEPTGKLV